MDEEKKVTAEDIVAAVDKWAAEGYPPRCDGCRWWKWPGEDVGDCCRHPPRVILDRDGDEITVWPETDNDDGCAEWQPKGK
jgi:hypothetical protein